MLMYCFLVPRVFEIRSISQKCVFTIELKFGLILFFSTFRAKICYFAMSSEIVTLTQMASSEISDINSILNEKMFLQTYFSLNKIC